MNKGNKSRSFYDESRGNKQTNKKATSRKNEAGKQSLLPEPHTGKVNKKNAPNKGTDPKPVITSILKKEQPDVQKISIKKEREVQKKTLLPEPHTGKVNKKNAPNKATDPKPVITAILKKEQPDLQFISEETERDVLEEDEGRVVVKHPLQSSWTLFYFKSDYSNNWNLNNLEVKTISTIEDFWALYNYIVPASRIPMTCDYSFFRKGIRPEWEDTNNVNGGKWILSIDKRKDFIDRVWLEMLLALIGNTWGNLSQDVCGVVVNIRSRLDKVSIWTGSSHNTKDVLMIGKLIREIWKLPNDIKINYVSHAENKNKRAGLQKKLFTI